MLEWKRERDGEHNGKPCYEYHATGEDGAKYHIVWASNHGGTFGYTAVTTERDEHGSCHYLTSRRGIIWGRQLWFCKAECEKIEACLVACKILDESEGRDSEALRAVADKIMGRN